MLKQNMDQTMILQDNSSIYKVNYDFDSPYNISDLNNKLFCTFTTLEGLEGLVKSLSSQYSIMYNKMFALYIKSNDEYVLTYNVDQGNVTSIPENTILVHRKKETNTLYTINALNELIKSLNGGVVDTKFPINWQHYKNCILLTQHNELKQLNTKIHKIIEV
tara:strand:+ start:10862 stop:11347 length:486 start_codon:yes stop_codon:yes gene_type:complete